MIAEKFDVTLEALTAANGWASDYSELPERRRAASPSHRRDLHDDGLTSPVCP